MKKYLAMLLGFALLLSGCGKAEEPVTEPSTEAPTTEATTEPTTEPTEPPTEPEPVYYNPLTGEEVDEPITRRIFAVSINNLMNAMPHYGVADADIYLEMIDNGSIIRGLAMFADVSKVEAIGSVRSTRFMFSDIVTRYDAIVAHAGGSEMVLNDIYARGIDGFNIDTASETSYSFRDRERMSTGIGWEHCLFARGDGLYAKAEEMGIDVSQDPEKTYGLTFTEDGTPANGETANSISVTFTGYGRKGTTMVYDSQLGKYVYNQYDMAMADGITGEPEAFENVVILFTPTYMIEKGYYRAGFGESGEGYYACGGKIIPVTWTCAGETEPFVFTTTDGQPLDFGVGNTYIAVAHPDSPVVYE